MTRTTCAPLSMLTAFMASIAFAGKPASLPDGFKSESAGTVQGLYAYAVAYHDHQDVQRTIQKASDACFARGRQLERSADVESAPQSRYWLYRSGDELVLFVSRLRVKIEAELCQVTVVEQRNVERQAAKAGQWPSPFQGTRCSRLSKSCHTSNKFGIKQRCRVEGNGFQLNRDCVSIERGPSHGLLLESAYESDDMSGYGFSVVELTRDTSFDASLFDASREW